MDMKTSLKLIVLISCLFNTGYSFVAYDCGNTDSIYETIALSQVKPCVPFKHNITTEKVEVQLIQEKIYKPQPYIRCYVSATHLLSRCGKTFDQPVEGGIYEEIEEVSRDDCEKMVRDKTYKYSNGKEVLIHQLKENFKNTYSLTTIGELSGDGTCTPGTPLHHNGRVHDRPVRSTHVTIIFSSGEATVNLKENKIVLENGVECEGSQTKCFDSSYGYVYWSDNISENMCNKGEDYDVLYEGPAQEVKEFTQNGFYSVYYIMPIRDHDFSILSMDKKVACGQHIITTEQPKLFIIKKNQDLPFKFKYDAKIYEKNIDFYAFFNSKLSLAVRHVKISVSELFSELMRLRCESRRESLFRFLTLAKLSPQDFAYDYFQQPGYTAVVTGEVIHVIKCVPVNVRIRPTGKCYNEIPVIYKNSSYYVTPRGKILSDVGTELSCSNALPIKFFIDGGWYVLHSSGLIVTSEPKILNPNSETKWEFKDMKGFSETGIYSAEEIAKLQETILNPIKFKAVESNVHRSLEGKSALNPGYSVINMFDKDEFVDSTLNVVREKWDHILNNLSWWGGLVTFFMMFGGLISVVIKTFNSMVNLVKLYKVFGFSFKLIFAFLTSVTNILLFNHLNDKIEENFIEAIEKEKKKQGMIELEEVASAPPEEGPMIRYRPGLNEEKV